MGPARSLLCSSLVLAMFAAAPRARAEDPCRPPCREGFVCDGGRCVSACNPPCGAGEVCEEGRRCVAAHPTQAPPPVTPVHPTPLTPGGGVPIVDQTPTGAHPMPAGGATHPGAVPPWHRPPGPLPPLPPEPEYQDPFVAVHVDVLGFLQFGPVLALELGASLAASLRLRFPNAGMAYYIAGGFDEELDFGIGVGAGLRYYLSSAGTMRGLHLGVLAEIERLDWSYEPLASDVTAEYGTTRLNLLGELGYRWGWTAFFFGAGARLGAAIMLSDQRDDLATITGGDVDEAHRGAFGMAYLEMGFYF